MRPPLPRRTLRVRLTAVYGGLFLASGAALLVVTYFLVVHATSAVVFQSQNNNTISAVAPVPHRSAEASVKEGAGTSGPRQGHAHPRRQAQAEARAQALRDQALRQHAAELRQLLIQSGVALGVMAVASIGLGWLVAGRVLRPLRTLTRNVRTISASNLDERLALGGPDDELKELGVTFNGLLDRLEGSFRAQRQFTANASHELRTPLARQRTLVQVALADPDATAGSLRQAHERVLVANRQQDRLIDALLTLARGEAGLHRREPVDLHQVTEHVVRARAQEARRRGLKLATALDPAPIAGDAGLVEQMVANLIDNALRHNVASGRINVATATKDRHGTLTVTNTGPEIPEHDTGRLFQPFQRLAGSRTSQDGGHGLGLSIVQAIGTAHDAAITAYPRLGGGLRITVTFPSTT
jgi:signal transduction histidine kinase